MLTDSADGCTAFEQLLDGDFWQPLRLVLPQRELLHMVVDSSRGTQGRAQAAANSSRLSMNDAGQGTGLCQQR
jgi:hypothetical protein